MKPQAFFRQACWLSVATSLLLALPAFADEPDRAAEAKSAFLQGRDAVKQGDLGAAFGHFKRSHELAPTPGALFNLAQCEEQLGKLSSALRHFQELVPKLEADDPRLEITKERAASLEQRAPKVRITLARGAPPGTMVTIDDTIVYPDLLGREINVDPGKHVIKVTARDRPERRYDVMSTEQRPAQLIEIAAEPGEAFATAKPAREPHPAKPAPPREPPRREPPREGPKPVLPAKSVLRPVGFAIGALGFIGIGMGAVAGALVIDRNNRLEAMCPMPAQCTAVGKALELTTRDYARVSNVGFIAGLTGVGLGTALVLWSGSAPKPAVKAGVTALPGGASAAVRGSF